MTYLIAAAGTGGHVFPGLSVGEALVDLGASKQDVMYVGGDRLEATVYPSQGYRFLQVELAGLKRSLSLQNARIPGVVMRARRRIAREIETTGVKAVLGMGGYVTIPAALAARKERVPFFNAEQNAEAGLANKVTARWAEDSFISFPETGGLAGTWSGNPVRKIFWSFDRAALRSTAVQRYQIDQGLPVVGVFGGSLGARVINEAVARMVAHWSDNPLQLVHLTGDPHVSMMAKRVSGEGVTWRQVGFEERMDLFFAVSDLVVARAGGAVAEITATGTPSILIPGKFGSGGHQIANAAFLEQAGAAVVVDEDDLDSLGDVVAALLEEPARRDAMTEATRDISKPNAARTIATAMMEAVG